VSNRPELIRNLLKNQMDILELLGDLASDHVIHGVSLVEAELALQQIPSPGSELDTGYPVTTTDGYSVTTFTHPSIWVSSYNSLNSLGLGPLPKPIVISSLDGP
jgi:hypothetical protein